MFNGAQICIRTSMTTTRNVWHCPEEISPRIFSGNTATSFVHSQNRIDLVTIVGKQNNWKMIKQNVLKKFKSSSSGIVDCSSDP